MFDLSFDDVISLVIRHVYNTSPILWDYIQYKKVFLYLYYIM